MSSYYTPGPWKFSEPKKKRGMISSAPFIESENPLPGHGETICALGAGIIHFANHEANGRLIEAAPELLRMLKKLVAEHDRDGGLFVSCVTECRKVIRKAEGGAK